jgi:DNA-binding response OmpR family regulator
VLVVEDDVTYARMLVEVARAQGFKALAAQNGQDALSLARKYQPDAVTLDVFLPDMLGWTVLNQLKHDPTTRHIPVQVLTVEEERQYGLERGAFSFMTKPTSKEGLETVFHRIREFTAPRVRELLVVEDDPAEQMSMRR